MNVVVFYRLGTQKFLQTHYLKIFGTGLINFFEETFDILCIVLNDITRCL